MPSLHNANYVVSFIKMLTSQKSEALDLLSVDFAAFHCVNSRCVDTTVSENIGKAHDVLLQAVIGACEEVPQVVRKDLLLRYLRRLTQFRSRCSICQAVFRSLSRKRSRFLFFALLRTALTCRKAASAETPACAFLYS